MFYFNFKKTLPVAISILIFAAYYIIGSRGGASSNTPLAHISQATQNIVFNFSGEVVKTTNTYINLLSVKKDNQKLKSENMKLLSELNTLGELNLENKRLKALLNFVETQPLKMVAAQVIGTDLNTGFQSLVINKGSSHGLKKWNGVISPEGVVGYIVEIGEHTAKVLLATDQSATIDAIVQRSRARGIISGFTNDFCLLKYLDKKEDISKDDIIVTSGRFGFFPKGFPIGKVYKLRAYRSSVSSTAIIKPSVDFNKLEEVLVLPSQELNVTSN